MEEQQELFTLLVKAGPAEHRVSLPAGSSVLDLKAELEPLAGLLRRQQKLIFKGKVLEDAQSLSSCKLVSGSKLMLLAAQGAAPPSKPAAAAAANKTPATGTSSLLAQKMADMAKAQPQQQQQRSPDGMAERRAAWAKTGIVALRDMQLTALDSSWLEGAPRQWLPPNLSHHYYQYHCCCCCMDSRLTSHMCACVCRPGWSQGSRFQPQPPGSPAAQCVPADLPGLPEAQPQLPAGCRRAVAAAVQRTQRQPRHTAGDTTLSGWLSALLTDAACVLFTLAAC